MTLSLHLDKLSSAPCVMTLLPHDQSKDSEDEQNLFFLISLLQANTNQSKDNSFTFLYNPER